MSKIINDGLTRSDTKGWRQRVNTSISGALLCRSREIFNKARIMRNWQPRRHNVAPTRHTQYQNSSRLRAAACFTPLH